MIVNASLKTQKGLSWGAHYEKDNHPLAPHSRFLRFNPCSNEDSTRERAPDRSRTNDAD